MRPKQILPRQCLMTTRRTLNREFLLTPNRRVSEAFGYFLAVAATRTGTGIWGGILMSNHPHLGIVDSPNADADARVGNRDEFFRILHREFAKWRNSTIIVDARSGAKRRGQFWDGERVNEVPLMGEGAIEERVLYMLMNPQRAGIVRRIGEWTGFMIRPKDWGTTMTFRRPKGAPTADGFPDVAKLEVMRPPIRWELTTDELRIRVMARLREQSDKEHASRLERGLTKYLGMRACRRQRPTARPRTRSGDPGPSVLYAADDPARIEKARQAKASFDKTYREQRKRLLQGLPVEFPAGSVRLPRLLGLDLAPVKPGEPTVLPLPPP